MPPTTTEAALNLLHKAKTASAIDALIQAIAPGPNLRQALVERYDDLAAHPKRDPSASLRAALLRGLRPLTTTERTAVTMTSGGQR